MSSSPTSSIASTSSLDSSSPFSRYDAATSPATSEDSSAVYSPRFGLFGNHGSDLTLRSSDNVLFRVHKARLVGSAVFRDMLELGNDDGKQWSSCNKIKTVSSPAAQQDNNLVFEVPMTEDARTLEDLLPFFYDDTDDYPDVDAMDFDRVLAVYSASLKYSMSLVEHVYRARLRRMLQAMTAEQAFQLWKVCTVHDRRELAGQALLQTRKGDIMSFDAQDITSLHPRDVDELWRSHMLQSQSTADMLFSYAWTAARGDCFFFNAQDHSIHMRKLVHAKSSGVACQDPEPIGFRTCQKCRTMAEELGLDLQAA